MAKKKEKKVKKEKSFDKALREVKELSEKVLEKAPKPVKVEKAPVCKMDRVEAGFRELMRLLVIGDMTTAGFQKIVDKLDS